jgi:FO synthase
VIVKDIWPNNAEVARWVDQLGGLTLPGLLERARAEMNAGHGDVVSFSRKVFIPLTRLCRDVCGYCAFAEAPQPGRFPYLIPEEVIDIAAAGANAGCTEALFTLGERPEERYRVARDGLASLGHDTTLSYLAAMARYVVEETGLLPHVNAGVMGESDLAMLRKVSVSQGLMLEGTSQRLTERGGPHFGSKGKRPEARIETIAAAGRLSIPFTTGILIGLGESRADRIESLLIIRALQLRFGHIQEVIVQNFQPKPGTRMANVEPPTMDDLLWTAAAARLILGPTMNIQVPPNLSYERFPELLRAGINDWGGASPVTPDHVNPEARWPELDRLNESTEQAGFSLVPRLPIYPATVGNLPRWIDAGLHTAVIRASDATGWARADPWSPGLSSDVPVALKPAKARGAGLLTAVLRRADQGDRLNPDEIETLFEARGAALDDVVAAADALRVRVSGETVRYVVNRNINYTNVCSYRCSFCAFSKGRSADRLRGRAYEVDLHEVTRRAAEAWHRGATEVCMQGGIHPRYTGQTYLDLLAAAKRGAPSIHVHAFSPLEVFHGAATLDLSVGDFLRMLRDAGLGSLPGTAAEILDDGARAILCPDKLSSAQWIHVVEEAHRAGLPTTSTVMFGHIDQPRHWATHLLALRDLQSRTKGISEFVPLPFVHMEAPLFHKGLARRGPTFRETVLMHAVARLVLHPLIPNIQVSWVKLGAVAASSILRAGANDLGGTLMNESISRAAGTQHGQEMPPAAMDALIRRAGRTPEHRSTLYGPVPDTQSRRAYAAAPLLPVVLGHVTSNRRPPMEMSRPYDEMGET